MLVITPRVLFKWWTDNSKRTCHDNRTFLRLYRNLCCRTLGYNCLGLIIKPQLQPLFTEEELSAERNRLTDYEYNGELYL